MDIHELSREQLIQVKESYLVQTMDCPSWSDIADADNLISDKQVFEEFASTDFVEEDFI